MTDFSEIYTEISVKFSVISLTIFSRVAIALSYRFKYKSHTGWCHVCPFVGKCKILFFTEK